MTSAALITAFRAALDEQEATVRDARYVWPTSFAVALNPAYVLADIAAKRKLLEELLSEPHATLAPGGSTEIYCPADYGTGQPCDCGRDERVDGYVRILAEAYGIRP